MDRNTGMPAPVVDVRDARLSPELPTRAEATLPPGYTPPPLVNRVTRATQLQYVADGLGGIRLAADLLTGPLDDRRRSRAALDIAAEAGRLQRLVRALAAGALAVAVVAAGLVAGPAVGAARAAEVPQPDPAAALPVVPPPAPVLRRTEILPVAIEDGLTGRLWVEAYVHHYDPARGWVPSRYSPVQVQELTRRGWRTRATLTTTRGGWAWGRVPLGVGVHVVRLVRPQGATVTRAVTCPRWVELLPDAVD